MILYATARASEFFALDHHGDCFDIRGELIPQPVYRSGLYATRDNVKAYKRHRNAVALSPETAARRRASARSSGSLTPPPLPQTPAGGSASPS